MQKTSHEFLKTKNFTFSIIKNGRGKTSMYDRKEQLLSNIGYVFTCNDIIASDVAEVAKTFHITDKKGDLVEGGEVLKLQELLLNPNTSTTGFNHHYVKTVQFGVNGGSFIYLGSKMPIGMWILPSYEIDIIVKNGEVTGYENKRTKTKYDPEEILYIKRPNPDTTDPYGQSVVQAGALSIDRYNYMNQTNNTLLENDSTPSIMLSYPSDVQIDPTKAKAIKEKFMALFKRGRAGYGEPFVGSHGVQVERLRLTPQEMEFLESQRFTREDIFSLFKVPLNKAGIKTTNDNKNTEETEKQYRRGVIKPIMEMYCQAYTQIAQRYGDYYVSYDQSSVTFEDQEFKHQQLLDWYTEGIITAAYIQDQFEIPDEYRPEEKEPEPESKEPEKSLDKKSIEKHIKKLKRAEEIGKYRDSARRKTNRIINRFEPRIKKILDEILSNAVKEKTLRDDLDLDKHIEEMETLSLLMLPEALKSGFKHVKTFLDSNIEFPASSGRVAKFISDRKNLMKDSINKTLFDEIKKQLQESQSLGESVSELTERLKNIGANNAHRIAVTETTVTFNEGTMLSMELNNIQKKMWLTMRDSKVRAEHSLMDGETKDLREAFSNGLEYPSEINCRCTVSPVLE